MVEADIHLRLLHTSILDIYIIFIRMLSHESMSATLYRYTSQVGPRFGKSGSLVEWN